MRVLLVEDNKIVREGVTAALKSTDHFVDSTGSGETAWFLGSTENYDCIILDLNLPDLDGLKILENWRAENITTPVIILTTRAKSSECVRGINLGADDYLTKPFRMEELLARLNAVVRRSKGHASSIMTANGMSVNLLNGTVTVRGRTVELAQLELRALVYLMQNKGSAISSHELLENVYGVNAHKNRNALEALIRRLRRKLQAPVIRTRRGIGYIIDNVNASTRPTVHSQA